MVVWAETCTENNTINRGVEPGFIIILIIIRHNRDENVLRMFRKLLHVIQDYIFLSITHWKKEMKEKNEGQFSQRVSTNPNFLAKD